MKMSIGQFLAVWLTFSEVKLDANLSGGTLS